MRQLENGPRQNFELGENRLETPDMVGYSSGMTATGVIARKLCRIYTAPADVPEDILDLAGVIDRELGATS